MAKTYKCQDCGYQYRQCLESYVCPCCGSENIIEIENQAEAFRGLNICPVCGEYVFEKENSFEICPVCGWEDDRLQKLNPDMEGGANKLSLNQYIRKYYEKEEREEE